MTEETDILATIRLVEQYPEVAALVRVFGHSLVEIERLQDLLSEASGWNWLDDDAENTILKYWEIMDEVEKAQERRKW